MTGTSCWHPIETAPQDGTLCLLLDQALERNASMPRGRKVQNDYAVVGRWHVPKDPAAKSDWVTDIRAIDYDDDQPFWDACPVEPTHWMALPNAPPHEGWSATDTLPIAYEYVLLYVPGLTRIREHPMDAGGRHSPGHDMIVGCQVTNGQTPAHPWLSDLCESYQIDNDPEDLGVEPAGISPTHWMALPPPPQ